MAKPTKHRQKDVDDADEIKAVAARRVPRRDTHGLPDKHGGSGGVTSRKKPHAIDEAAQAAKNEGRKLGRLSNEDSNELDQSADDQAADQAERSEDDT